MCVSGDFVKDKTIFSINGQESITVEETKYSLSGLMEVCCQDLRSPLVDMVLTTTLLLDISWT